jgi:hypothetical protein
MKRDEIEFYDVNLFFVPVAFHVPPFTLVQRFENPDLNTWIEMMRSRLRRVLAASLGDDRDRFFF